MYKNLTSTEIIGKKLIYLPVCHSSNTSAAQLANTPDIPEGSIVLCGEQTAGRGQRGSYWEALPDKNFTLSVILHPRQLQVQQQFLVQIAVSLGVHSFLQGLLPNGELSIKWPNDIYYEGKKLVGILLENQLRGQKLHYCIAGIGINVNQQSFTTANATSLAQITGRQYQLPVLLEQLAQQLERYYLQLLAGGEQRLRAAYTGLLYRYQERHTYKDKREGAQNLGTFSGEILGINALACLCCTLKAADSCSM